MNIADVVTLARAGFTAEQIARMYAPAAPVVQAQPAPVVQAQPAPVVQAQPAPVVQAQPAPVVQAQPAPDNNPVMEQLKLLTNTLQANAILNSNQPKQETVDDILASIINPTKAN